MVTRPPPLSHRRRSGPSLFSVVLLLAATALFITLAIITYPLVIEADRENRAQWNAECWHGMRIGSELGC